MSYNLTNITDSNDFYGVYAGVNALSGGLLSSLLLFSLFLIIFISFKDKYETKTVFLADSFFITLVAALFWAGQLISLEILLVPVGLLVASIIAFLLE